MCGKSPIMLTSLLLSLSITGQPVLSDDGGAALYREHCAVCHQASGTGVPMMQPSLKGAPKVLGKPQDLIYMVFQGSKAVPEGTSDWDNEMPGFEFLSDAEIAKILTYVRSNFGNSENVITQKDVAAHRADQ